MPSNFSGKKTNKKQTKKHGGKKAATPKKVQKWQKKKTNERMSINQLNTCWQTE